MDEINRVFDLVNTETDTHSLPFRDLGLFRIRVAIGKQLSEHPITVQNHTVIIRCVIYISD